MWLHNSINFVYCIFHVHVAMLYRNYEEGLQRQVERLGSGKTVDGSVNIIVNVKEKMEYEYLE